jgi:hypothetical protein
MEKIHKIEIKIIEWEVTDCIGPEFLAQDQMYTGCFWKLSESMRGSKAEEQGKKTAEMEGGKEERDERK